MGLTAFSVNDENVTTLKKEWKGFRFSSWEDRFACVLAVCLSGFTALWRPANQSDQQNDSRYLTARATSSVLKWKAGRVSACGRLDKSARKTGQNKEH